MEFFHYNNIKITLNKKFSNKYLKLSYPVKFGIISLVESDKYIYYFNLNGEVRYIQIKGKKWPGDEWLKRTITNHWIYYTPGIYTGIYSFLGEYYLPCFQYASNSIFAYKPFEDSEVHDAVYSIDRMIKKLHEILSLSISESLMDFLQSVIRNNNDKLLEKSEFFYEILGDEISVLPPDTRHVDYDVIPVIISDGCLYNCNYCIVKSGKGFRSRDYNNIDDQLNKLKDFYGKDLINYNSLFLGTHDSLNAGEEIIRYTIQKADEILHLDDSYMTGRNIFIFGSVGSLLSSRETLWQFLNKSGYNIYINIGFESADQETLKIINKPVEIEDIRKALDKIIDIAAWHENIEVSVNFLIGNDLPKNHYKSIIDLCGTGFDKKNSKITLYLSPSPGSNNITELQNIFKDLKTSINLPVFLYIIQRL